MIIFNFILFSVFINCAFCKHEFYMGYRIYNVKLNTTEQENNLQMLKSDMIDYWRNPSLKHNVIGKAMVPPSHVTWFEEKLDELNVNRDVYIQDVYEYLNRNVKTRDLENDPEFNFNSYYRYDIILDYLRSIEEAYSNSEDLIVNVVDAGTTDENRPLIYVKITANNSIEEKPVAIIEAGINPREWITIPSSINIIDKLLEIDQRKLSNELEWIIIPVLNPDGYEYTHTNLRLWTKSRSTRSNLGQICPGVNINRNFDIDWMFSDSSSSPCSHLYGGLAPFSEPESQMIRDIFQEYGSRIGLYISLQNNGGFISYPWQYERAASGMFRQHHLLGLEMISLLGDDYKLDVGALALGDRSSGTSSDYMMNNGVLYALNLDIEQVDGVNVPADKIRPIADKVWKAVAIAANNIFKLN